MRKYRILYYRVEENISLIKKKFYHTPKKNPKIKSGRFRKKDIYKCPFFQNPLEKFWENLLKTDLHHNAVNSGFSLKKLSASFFSDF
jgi:hypothetical protein